MEPLDDNTLDEVARLICGDDGPIYRRGWELTPFLRRAGWADVPDHDSAPRREWVLGQLRLRRDATKDIERVLLRLADPREYLSQPADVSEVAQRINAFLVHEGYQIRLPGGRPKIVPCDPALGNPSDLAPVELKTTVADLVADPAFAAILQRRLDEARTCHTNGAHVAAIIMLGSFLEGVLLDVTRTRLPNGLPKRANQMHLSDLIDLARSQEWLQVDVHRFCHELRCYRNLVHPDAESREKHSPDHDTVQMCWPVVYAALNDLAATAPVSN